MPTIYNYYGHGFRDVITEGSGSVKALLVGINYRGTNNQLGGCINDVLLTRQRILSEYPHASIQLMTDDTPMQPTRNNILRELDSLVRTASPGDVLMFHYSGHGGQVTDLHGDEEDGYDETICPIDFRTPRIITVNGQQRMVDSQIIDDEIHDIISNVPQRVKLLMLSDSCHSGTIGDLKNDLEHYHGPAEWQDGANLSLPSQLSSQIPPQVQQQSVLLVNNIIQCDTCWIYAPYLQELWLTPLNSSLREQFGTKKIVVKLENNIPAELVNNSNKLLKYNTTFKQLDNGQYEVFTSAVPGIKLVIGPSSRAIQYIPSVERARASQLQFSPSVLSRSTGVISDYDHKTGRYNHYSGGKKRSVGMKHDRTCQGGELRIISGCEESQTSADTGTNGACTRALWQVIDTIGGLHNFFPKIFSHNIEDLRAVQDAINRNLAGFSQHSVISWDHALPGNTNAGRTGRNIRAFRENLPQQQSYVPLYTDMPSYYRTYYNTRSTSNYNVGSEYNSPSNYYYGTGLRYSNAPRVKRFI